MKIIQITRSKTEFQQTVEEQELVLQLGRELEGESILEIIELQAGLFNNTYRVKTSQNRYILKVAPVPNAGVFYNEQYLMLREKSLSQQLQEVSKLIPSYLSFFKIGNRHAFLQSFVEGRLWHDIIDSLSDAENTLLWQQLGEFAKKLHTTKGKRFGYPAPFEQFNTWFEFIADNVAGMVEDARQLEVFCEEIESYIAYLPKLREKLNEVTTPWLQHGDLWPRNVIVDGQGENIHITAVIDGERAFWGDPVSDWVLILYDVPEAFWQGYGENLKENSDPIRIAIYKGMYFILNILEASRFNESDHEPRQHLLQVNRELESYLAS